MSYTNESGRTQILTDAAGAAEALAEALAALGEAYEHLDERTGERMEDVLFRPLQAALGQLRRTLSEFAHRYGLAERQVSAAAPPPPGHPRELLERAGDAAARADETLAELQDSLLPVEVGDQPLREGLAAVRGLIAPLPARADTLVRTFGR